MANRLKLTRQEVENVQYDVIGAFRLRVDASDPSGSGTDPNVFLYNRGPLNPHTGLKVDTFYAIASPVDMAEYPVGGPDLQTTYPFFRLPYVELDFRATSQAEDTWNLIVAEVSQLLNALNRLEALTVTQEQWVGDPYVPAESESASLSDSVSDSVSGSVSGSHT